jgi:hypothetical protein
MPRSSSDLLPHRNATLAGLALFVAAIITLLAMGRPAICLCGFVRLWAGQVQSPENSQQLTDWYSFSHMIHGMLFYGAAHVLWRGVGFGRIAPAAWALPVAVLFEAAWELLENSPIIIDRYRAVTISWGYSGDSVLNSASDIAMMTIGFLIAARLPVWATVALALSFELFTLIMIRDNLALNLLMLGWPVDAVRKWQAGV